MTPSVDAPRYGLYIDGTDVATTEYDPVYDKYTGVVIAEVARPAEHDIDAAVHSAAQAFRTRPLGPRERFTILTRTSELIAERAEHFAVTMIRETGFTRKDVAAEIQRALETLRIAAEEGKRIAGEIVPIRAALGFERDMAFTLRVPLGVVCAITPFNAPLNTVCHKVAPALAAGNTVVLKPATATPLTAHLLARAFADAGLPPGHLNVVTGPGSQVGRWLTAHPVIRFYAFTGSTAVGEDIQARAGLRRTCMELGNISATIVCEDADLDRAIPLLASAAFRKAGQVCTSVQRVYVQRIVFNETVERLGAATSKLAVGDPRQPATDVGPLIDVKETTRAASWVEEATARGARAVAGGRAEGRILYPTVLADVPADARVMRSEVFAPGVSLVPYDTFDDAIAAVNGTPYGLQAGVFTRDLSRALAAAERLEVGGVIVNGTSSTRADLMPYGGTKASGFGKEGPRYAIEEMTEVRLVLLRH